MSHTYAAVGMYTVTLTAGDGSTAAAAVTCSDKGNPKRPRLSCS